MRKRARSRSMKLCPVVGFIPRSWPLRQLSAHTAPPATIGGPSGLPDEATLTRWRRVVEALTSGPNWRDRFRGVARTKMRSCPLELLQIDRGTTPRSTRT